MPNPNTSDVEKHQRKPAAASKAGNWPPEETPLFPEIGYGKIALDMAAAGSEMPIFRKFGDLSMLALLRLQADILHRRERFRKLCRTSEGPPQFLNSFQWMREDCRCSPTRGFRGNESGAANDEVSQIGVDQSSQKDCPECLLREITEKLKEYHEMMLRLVNLASLERPRDDALTCIQTTAEIMRQGACFDGKNSSPYEFLSTKSAGEYWTWIDRKGLEDMVTIQQPRPQGAADPFEEYVTHKLYDAWDSMKKTRLWAVSKLDPSREGDYKNFINNPRTYHDVSTMGVITAVLVAAVGALFPVISILILYHIKKTLKRIYALIGLTIAFAVTVKVMTGVGTVKVFSMTAAFAAVEVVFVGSAPPDK